MLTNDLYVAQLEKMAADEDNAQVANKEFRSNRGDNRRYLGSLFNRADEVEKQMSSAADKVVGGKKESGSPFIKEAARQLFAEITSGGGWAKTASPHYQEVAFHSFLSELEKLAAVKGQTLAQLMHKNRVAAASPKVWDLSSPVSAGAKAALPQGSGTTAAQPGLLSRAASALGLRK